jgi:hypothetical protein
LFDGALQPANGAGVVRVAAECASATVGLTPDHAAAQRGLWLAARSIAIVKGVDTNDPSAFLDAARVLVAEHAVSTADVAGRVESFGFLLLGSFAQDRDPALSEAIAARLRGAVMPDDPAALLSGRSRVADSDGVAIEAVADPAAAATQAIERLLTARFGCVGTSEALELTEAGLLVIGAARVAD